MLPGQKASFFAILVILLSLQLWTVFASIPAQLVINEIAFKGTNASPSDEWIELYNTSNQSLDLSGWTFHINDKIIPLAGTVQPYGFALLERSDNQTISDLEAHIIFTGALSDSGAVLKIKDSSGALVDQVSAFYSTPTLRSSIERINPLISGDISFNWRVHDLSTVNAHDATGGVILGTPGLYNSSTILQFGVGYQGIIPGSPPAAPVLMLSQQVDHQISISWEPLPNILFYELSVDGVVHQTKSTSFQGQPNAATSINYQLLAKDFFLQPSSPSSGSISYQVPEMIQPRQVLINEFDSLPPSGPEWIELYNPSSTWKDLSNCRFDDASSTIHSFLITDAIGPQAQLSVDISSQKLNNSGDTISFICSNNGNDLLIDSIFYGSRSSSGFIHSEFGYLISDGYIPEPNDLNTLGRSPDGSDRWFLIPLATFSSKGSSNPDLTPVKGVVFPQFVLGEDQLLVSWDYPSGANISGVKVKIGLESEGFEHQLLQTVRAPITKLLIPNPPREVLEVQLISFNSSEREAFGLELSSLLINNLGLTISEVLPYPKSGLEFIELHNATDDIIDLTDFELNVANASNDINNPSGAFTFFGFEIYPGEYFALPIDPDFYGFRLSNLRSQIIIFDEFGVPVANLDYISPPRGVSVAYDGQLQSTLVHPTPNAANVFSNESPVAIITVQGSGKTTGCTTLSFNPTGADSTDADKDELSYSWFYLNSKKAVIHTENVKNPKTFKLSTDVDYDFELQLIVRDAFGGESITTTPLELGHCGGKRRTKSFQSSPTSLGKPDNRSLLINEIYPNPPGKDSGIEFLELFNPHNSDVSLKGWKLGSPFKKTQKKLRGTVPGQGFYLLQKISIKNAGDTLQIFNPAEDLIDEVSYPKAPEGKTWSRNKGGDYLWSIPTPAALNDFPFEQELVYRQLSADIIIHSLLPNPLGKDSGREWIRLFNRSSSTVDISGWQLKTKSKSFTIPQREIRKSQTYRLFSKTSKLALTNASGTVQLFDNTGKLIDEVKWAQKVADDLILTRDDLITAELPPPEQAIVVKVLDGDTIQVQIFSGLQTPNSSLPTLETVRLLGVDTPETVHPFKPVEYWGKEASSFTKSQLLNKSIRLEYDLTKRGKYGRLLAYVYLDDQHFNAELIRQGYAFAYLNYPFRYREEFRQLELQAQRNKVGLWSEKEAQQLQTQHQESAGEEQKADEFEVLQEEIKELEEENNLEEEPLKNTEDQNNPKPLTLNPQASWSFLKLSEVLANPKGKDKNQEYIELLNTGSEELNLEGWRVENKKGKAVLEFSEVLLIPPGKNMLFQDLKRSLKNSNESLTLIDPSGHPRDRLSYELSVKDDQVWVRHPLTGSWQLLSNMSPGEQNPIAFISTDTDTDRDGIPDTDEFLFGMDPNQWDSDGDGLPDDYEVIQRQSLEVKSYQDYLAEALRYQIHQTKRTMKISGVSRPYTIVQLTFYSTPKVVQVPVQPDGSWEYTVAIGLESGKHHLEVIAIDPQQQQSSALAFTPFTLLNRLNASKLPQFKRKRRQRKKGAKPLYLVSNFQRQHLSGIVQLWDPSQRSLLLAQSSSVQLPYAQLALAKRLFSPQSRISFQQEPRSHKVDHLRVIPRAQAKEKMPSKYFDKPLEVLFFLCIALGMSFYFSQKKNL